MYRQRAQDSSGWSDRLISDSEYARIENGHRNTSTSPDTGLVLDQTSPRSRRPRRVSISAFPPSKTTLVTLEEDPQSMFDPFRELPRMSRIRRMARVLLRSRQTRNRFLFATIIVAALTVFLFFALYEPHIEISLYSKRWIRQQVQPIPPLAGCFENVDDERYNITELVWGKRSLWEVQSGVDMMRGMDCYDFAGTIGRRGPMETPAGRVVYHTYWRTDLIPFGSHQEHMLRSFFATQPQASSQLLLWSNGDLTKNDIIQRYLERFPESFAVKMVDIKDLAKGTALDGNTKLHTNDKKAWVDGDLLRLLVLWQFGGVWVDMDSLLTRSLHPLLEHEFVTQWDCYNKPYTPLNGALMHFHAHSPYLCEAFHIMATSPAPRPGSTDWGSLLYIKLWRALVHSGIQPFKVLPWCFSDGRSCRIDNRLPDPFQPDGKGQDRWEPTAEEMTTKEGGLLDNILKNVFAVHLHNQWEKDFPEGGWVERLLLKRYGLALNSS